MTTINDKTTVSLSGRSGLLAAVPHMLGFHPQESIVMVCFSGPRRRVGPVIRFDLPDGTELPGHRSPPMAELQSHVDRHADEVALLCYTEQPERPVMFYEVLDALEAAGTHVLDAMLVRDGTVYPCCVKSGVAYYDEPADGEDAQALAMSAASALSGRGVLADRQALRDSIAGPTGADARRASAALHKAADRLVGTVRTTGPIDRDELRALAAATLDRALSEVTSSAGVALPTCALVALLLCDKEIRDELIARAVTDRDPPWLAMLIAVARATPDEDAAEVCAALSLVAYRRGDGALAQVAVDRCLVSEPDHRLAHLMLGVMAAGLPPDTLEGFAAAVEHDQITPERPCAGQ